jgi:hypothetical protein
VILIAATLGFEKNFITSPTFCSGMKQLLSAPGRVEVGLPGWGSLFTRIEIGKPAEQII